MGTWAAERARMAPVTLGTLVYAVRSVMKPIVAVPRRTDYHYRRKGRWITKTVLCERKATDNA